MKEDAAGKGLPPVVVIGMHRSGTSMLTGMLRELGLFVGWRVSRENEPVVFNRLNDWILNSCGGSWYTPSSIEHILEHEEGVELAAGYLRKVLGSPRAMAFLGPGRYLRYRDLLAVAEPWGWKDPRTTVTLPVWLRIFPGARILSVVRNGVDVAQSLRHRERGAHRTSRGWFERHPNLVTIRGKRGWFGMSPRIHRLEEGFRLWEEYLGYAERFTRDLENPRFEVRFEDFLARPGEHLRQAAEFCGLDARPEHLARVASQVKAARSLAFSGDPELLDFYNTIRDTPWMRRYGYHELPGTSD